MFYQHLPPYMYRKPVETHEFDCFSNFACSNAFDKIMNEFSETGKINSEYVYELNNACGKKCEYIMNMYITMATQSKKKQEK